MKKREGTDAEMLRARAEDRLKEKPSRPEADGRDMVEESQRLVHELQVHQIELELQNEELQASRAELEAGLERYSHLYDFAPVGYLTLDRDGAIQKVNLTGARLLGLERARLVGTRLGRFVSAEYRPAFNALLDKVFESQARQGCDLEICPETIAPIWLHIDAIVADDQGRECRAVLADVTERRRIEESLRFRVSLLDYAANHSLEELLQETLDKVGALTESPIGFYHFVEPDQNTLRLAAWSRRTVKEFCSATGQGSHYPIEQAGVWADCARQRWPVIHNDYASLPHRKGLPEGHAAITRELVVPIIRSELIVAIVGVGNKPSDYTDSDVQIVSHLADVAWTIIERKRAEQALQESEARYREAAQALAEADRNKNHFLAVLSHELRNPLAPITNSLYILDRAVPGGAQALRAHAVIARQVGQLSRLVDDLLDTTRIGRNKLTLHRERLELNQLVRRTLDDYGPQFEKNQVGVELAPAPRPVFVNGDGNRLAQIVGNLLQNAAKFTGPGGHTRVSVSTDDKSKRAVVRVADTGVGMDAPMLERLFQPFAQADTTLDRSKGGLGLGLALVRGLVELHGGTISAHSPGLGQGAEFVVRLPLALEQTAADGPARSSTEAQGGRRRVLVIEDNIDAAESLREAIEFSGHEVEVAYNGPAGIAKAHQYKPEVVFCDIGLPGMDGFDVARAFRADHALKGAHLVALSGYALPEDVQRAFEAGFDQHLAKPPNLLSLEQTLAHMPSAARELASEPDSSKEGPGSVAD
ncbi:MAG: GAF domain-containing protein [Polyangia bacterium]|jgi:PAS domain S-box-containing protein